MASKQCSQRMKFYYWQLFAVKPFRKTNEIRIKNVTEFERCKHDSETIEGFSYASDSKRIVYTWEHYKENSDDFIDS